jgi:hypothetical protein
MANSTLSPGHPSEAIVRLRQAAMKEMDAPQLNVKSVAGPSFDMEHDAEGGNDIDNFPKYQGDFNPHVGNGRGPIG